KNKKKITPIGLIAKGFSIKQVIFDKNISQGRFFLMSSYVRKNFFEINNSFTIWRGVGKNP
ncbi:MAG: hypothetical protein Q8932_20170, partial [Bacteroidota bacterium]|nr:hypothetical protein [Bacteroidota bacterium]